MRHMPRCAKLLASTRKLVTSPAHQANILCIDSRCSHLRHASRIPTCPAVHQGRLPPPASFFCTLNSEKYNAPARAATAQCSVRGAPFAPRTAPLRSAATPGSTRGAPFAPRTAPSAGKTKSLCSWSCRTITE